VLAEFASVVNAVQCAIDIQIGTSISNPIAPARSGKKARCCYPRSLNNFFRASNWRSWASRPLPRGLDSTRRYIFAAIHILIPRVWRGTGRRLKRSRRVMICGSG
jgi:hypothetical protein